MPQSWRPITEHKVEQFGDVVIATEIVNPSKSSRYYNIYTYGQLFGTAHSLADAKYQVEVIYGPLRWHRQPNPPVEVIHYYFGRTTEFTEPTTIYTADLPMLGYAASRRSAYQTAHRPLSDGAPLHDLTSQFPPDVYSHPHYYSFGGDEMGERKTHAIIREYRDEPDKPITIYRAVPDGVMSINTGDWVTITREYAAMHALHPTDPEQDYPIISATVPARTLLNGGNDLLEWGYWGPPITGRTASQRTASSNVIYRGLRVVFPSDIQDAVRELASPPLEEDQIGRHKRIGRILVEWLQDNHWEPGLGLGRHWTRSYAMAETAAWAGGPFEGWKVILTATYNPADENPKLHNTTPLTAINEEEVNLLPGAVLNIIDVEMLHVYVLSGERRSVLDSPMRATASLKTASKTYYHGTPFILRLGDTILPASKNLMRHRNFDMSREDRIYLTDDIGEAYWWAAMASVGAPFKVFPAVYRVDNVENPQVSSAMGQFELLAESAEVVEDVTEQAKAAWLAKGSNRYQQVVNMGGIEDSPRNRGYFLIASRNATRKTGNYLTKLDPHIQHPDTRYALNLITEALAALPDPHALSLAKQVRIYLAGKPNPDSEKEQAIQRFLIRYADKIIKSHGDQPAASVPNYQSRELQQAWDTLTPHL